MSEPTETILQTVHLPGTPSTVYDALVDPERHAAFTGAAATGAARVGETFTAWDGYITGRHLELERGHRIVQEWSTTEWPEGRPPSTVEILLAEQDGGTRLSLVHTGVPAEQADDYREGWIDYYWAPLRAYLEMGV